MTLNSKDWKRLQRPLILLMTVLFLIIACTYYAYVFCQTQLQTAQTQQLQLLAMRAKLQTSEAEKNDIDIFFPQYESLINQGFIGEERRQAWVATLGEIQKSYQLFKINYELGPLETVQPAYLTNFSPFILHQSTMKINFDLLHEGDLITFTDALASKNLAARLLKSCVINQANQQNTAQARLNAQCEIDWLTLTEPSQIQSAASP